MRLRYTRRALADLQEIAEFIAQDRHVASRRVVTRLRRAALQLLEHPLMGRPGRVVDTRELSVARLPFVIAYRVTTDAVDVLAVIHTARLWPERF